MQYISSGINSQYPNSTIDKAFDKLNSSSDNVFVTNGSSNTWGGVKYDTPFKINEITLVQYNIGAFGCKNFKIEYSDDNENWVSILTGVLINNYDIQSFKINHDNYHKYWRLFIIDNYTGTSLFSGIGEMDFIGEYKPIKRMILKNLTTNQHYSLKEKTLIQLLDSSDRNMILHGIKQDESIELDISFNKINYVNEMPIDNVSSKVFIQDINDINKISNIKEVK